MTNNIDLNEIAKFSALADDWWNPNGKCKPLHIINPLRTEYVIQQAHSLQDKKVLDVGCGGGILSESLAKNGANVTGIDLAQHSLDIAKSHAMREKLAIDYQQISAEEHAKQFANQYDIVVCMEMLEHVPEPQSIINACAKMLKPDGLLFLSTINRNYKAKMLLIYGAEYISQLVPKGTHDFDRFIRPSELMDMVENSGLINHDIIGIEYQLLKNNFKLGHNVDVNYILTAKK